MNENQNSGYERLENQISWYDTNSLQAQKKYKWLKVTEIFSAALIPFSVSHSPIFAGLLGVVVVVLEGIQHLYQFQRDWVTFRTACESLRHEKYLYLARTGPYDFENENDALKELALRTESLISQEHSKWNVTRERAQEKKDQKP